VCSVGGNFAASGSTTCLSVNGTLFPLHVAGASNSFKCGDSRGSRPLGAQIRREMDIQDTSWFGHGPTTAYEDWTMESSFDNGDGVVGPVRSARASAKIFLFN